jgi:hypothetical protein
VGEWTSEFWAPDFGRWFNRELDEYEQSVLLAAIEHILEVQGPDICKSEYGTFLQDGLVEFRIRQSLNAIENFGKSPAQSTKKTGADRTVLLRVFVHFYGDHVVLLMHGLNKGNDSNEKRQRVEIARAKKILKAFKAEQKINKKRDR